MAKLTYTRQDVEGLCDRLETRAGSLMLADMPRLASDMRASAKLLRFMLNQGIPPTAIEIDVNNT
jgi:hypothetical protein